MSLRSLEKWKSVTFSTIVTQTKRIEEKVNKTFHRKLGRSLLCGIIVKISIVSLALELCKASETYFIVRFRLFWQHTKIFTSTTRVRLGFFRRRLADCDRSDFMNLKCIAKTNKFSRNLPLGFSLSFTFSLSQLLCLPLFLGPSLYTSLYFRVCFLDATVNRTGREIRRNKFFLARHGRTLRMREYVENHL